MFDCRVSVMYIALSIIPGGAWAYSTCEAST